MTFIRLIHAPSLLAAAMAFSACSRDGGSGAAPAAHEAGESAAKQIEVDAPIAHGDIDLVFATEGAPAYDPAADMLTYTARVSDNGKAPIASKGDYPVNIGVVMLDADGTSKSPPAKQDFVRPPLPEGLEPGEKTDLPIRFRVAPTLGGTVIVEAVQERVVWFRGYKKPVLTLGSFSRCNGDAKTVCTREGAAVVPAAQYSTLAPQ